MQDFAPSITSRWDAAASLATYATTVTVNQEWWATSVRRATLTPEHFARAMALRGTFNLLVLLEDWCGDAVNSVPYLQRIADANDGITLRVIERDRHLDLMDAHLTNGARAIPLVLIYDEQFAELGTWGARPAPLQQWVLEHGLQLDKETRYKQVRTWYARDRGHTIVEEMLSRLELLQGAKEGAKVLDSARSAA